MHSENHYPETGYIKYRKPFCYLSLASLNFLHFSLILFLVWLFELLIHSFHFATVA